MHRSDGQRFHGWAGGRFRFGLRPDRSRQTQADPASKTDKPTDLLESRKIHGQQVVIGEPGLQFSPPTDEIMTWVTATNHPRQTNGQAER